MIRTLRIPAGHTLRVWSENGVVGRTYELPDTGKSYLQVGAGETVYISAVKWVRKWAVEADYGQLNYETTPDHLSVPSYRFTKVKDILDIPAEPTWTDVAQVEHPDAPGSLYEIGMSIQGHMPDTNDVARVQFRLNGGAWTIYEKEAKDNDDTFGFTYLFPKEHPPGDTILLELQAQKETGGQQFDIQFCDVWIKRLL